MYYEDTPVIARIYGPSDIESMELFGPRHDDEELEFKMDQMDLG